MDEGEIERLYPEFEAWALRRYLSAGGSISQIRLWYRWLEEEGNGRTEENS